VERNNFRVVLTDTGPVKLRTTTTSSHGGLWASMEEFRAFWANVADELEAAAATKPKPPRGSRR
jgi:hypothetical protein